MGIARRRSIGLVLAVAVVAAACADSSDPFDLTDEGIACMRAKGYDASALIFSGDSSGVGFSWAANVSDPSTLVWRIDRDAGDLPDALDACLAELTAIAPLAYPAEVSISATEEAAIRRCIEAVPNAHVVSDISIKRYEDGSHSIDHIQDDEGLTTTELLALDRAISACLPEHP